LNPFRGVFATPELDQGVYSELSTLFAIIIYLLLGYFLEWIVKIFKDNLTKSKKMKAEE
jgi:hypothetical protein